jgi:PAS domain S-box-containing protein
MATQKRSSLPAHDPPPPVQAALPPDEDKFQFMFEHSIVGKSFTLPSGEMTVNAAFCEMLGYSRAALKNKTWQEITHPDDIGLTQGNHDQLLSGKKTSVRFNKRYLSKNGGVVWADETTCLCRDAAGRPLYLITEVDDITARRQAEEDLHKNEDRFTRIYNSVSDVLFALAVEPHEAFRFVSVNKHFLDVTGLSEEQVVGRPYQEVIPESARALALKNYKKAIRTKKSVQWEETSVYPVGARDGEVSVTPVFDETGKCTQLVGMVHDITEIKRIQKELQQHIEDMTLLATINQALNRGESLETVLSLLSNGLKDMFGGYGASLFMLTADRQKLVMQNLPLPSTIREGIEKLTGFSLTHIELDLHEAHPFRQAIENGEPQIINDPLDLQQSLLAYANAVHLDEGNLARVKKILPTILKLVGLKSEMVVPLVSEGELIGIMDVGGRIAFTGEDCKRVDAIAGQLTVALKRKQVEQALSQSENKLRALFAAMTDVVIIYSADGRYLEIAPTDQSNLYLTPDVLIGRSVHELFPKEQADFFVSKIGQALRTGQAVQFEYALQLDGAERWFSASASALSGNTVIWVAHNITLRKQAEEALRRSEARFRAVVENSSDGILFADADGRISYRSPISKHINGYLDKERLGQIIFETVHPDDQETFRQYWVQVVGHPGKPQKAEYRIRHKDRTWVWVDTTSVNLLANPDIQAIVVTTHNITARKQAELQKETVYQVLAAVSGQLDLHLLAQSAMETLARISDYPHVCLALPEENDTHWVIRGGAGRFAAEIGASYPIHQGVIGRAFKTGQVQLVRDTLDDPGYVRDIRVADPPLLRSEIAVPLRRGGRLLGVLNIESKHVDGFDDEDAAMIQSLADVIALAVENAQLYHDAQQEIAERKQSQELLQESEHKFRTLFDRAIDGVLIVDLETHHFFLSNPAICQMVGYTQAEFSGLRMEDIHPPEQLPLILERFNRPDLGGPSPSENVPVRRKDGSVFSADIAARLITLQGRTYLLSVFRDITARKLAEDKIREQLDELQRWYKLTLDRETRSLELKHEVNDLLRRLNQPVRYPSAEEAQA